MFELIADFGRYLKAIFTETWSIFFTLFDIVGVGLLLCPSIQSWARIIGGLIVFVSYLSANFILYRKLAIIQEAQANIHLEILEQGFASSHGSGSKPFPDLHNSPYGFTDQGLPDWCSVWAHVEGTNTGYERGTLVLALDEGKTKLPPFLDREKPHIWIELPMSIDGRSSSTRNFSFDFRLNAQALNTFAQSLNTLIKRKQKYRVALSYYTNRINGKSNTQRLVIEGDFFDFYQKVLSYWDENGFGNLAKVARGT